MEYKPLTEIVEIHDYLREPVNSTERNKRTGVFPYYGATGQVGWIDGYRQDGEYVLLGEDGAPFLESNKPKAYLVTGKCWVNNHAHVLRGKDGVCDNEYLVYALNSADYSNAVTGSTRLKLPQNTMSRIFIFTPSIEIQKQIASKLKAQLAEVETVRRALELQESDLETLQIRIFESVFSELDPDCMVRIGDFAETTSGSTPSRDNSAYWQLGQIAWVKTGEVAHQAIFTTEESISEKALAECSLTLLPPKTVLIAMYGQGKTRGQSAVLEIPATTNQACFAILPNESFLSEYLQYWLRYSYFDLRALSDGRGGNQANLNGAILKEFLVPLIEMSQQIAIAEKISTMLGELEVAKAAIRAAKRDADLLPNRLLAEAFNQ